MRDPLRLHQPSADIRTRRIAVNRATILSQVELTHDTYELVVACAEDSDIIHASAGQFVTLRFPGITQPRPYSLARDPAAEAPGTHTFFIRLVPDGEVSAWLAAGNRSGTEIEIAGPLGGFGLDDSSDPMICIAGGSGMSAIMALIEHACTNQLQRDCYFFYGARTQADLYCDKEIGAVAACWHPEHRFTFVQVLSEEAPDSDWTGAHGFVTDHIDEHWIQAGRIDPGKASAFFCGPPPMIEAGGKMLINSGMPQTRIFRDVFEDARSPAPVIDNRNCVLCDECLLVKPVENCIVETSGINLGSDGKIDGFHPIKPTHSSGLYYNSLFIDESQCIRCYACVNACPHDAISPDYTFTGTLRQRSTN